MASLAEVSIPIIDVSLLIDPAATDEAKAAVSEQIGAACRTVGFFCISNCEKLVPNSLRESLLHQAREFFERPDDYKMAISMKNSKVYRGFFPVGDELTSGRPDWKQGLYFERELDASHPHVQKGTPMHGKNQFPPEDDFPEFKETVLDYMRCMTQLGHMLMSAMAVSLGLDKDYFKPYTTDPFTPFRIFHYPADPVGVHADDGQPRFGVQEHTDYGVLTILAVDDSGLEVKVKDTGTWIGVPLVPETFIVNVGDMAELWTNGEFRATPHRVRNTTQRDRISLPFFFDPSWDAIIQPVARSTEPHPDAILDTALPAIVARTPEACQAAVDAYRAGSEQPCIQYGPYILSKVLRVFPQLAESSTG